MTTSTCSHGPGLRARLTRTAAASVLALSLTTAPAFAAEDVVDEGAEQAEETGTPAEEDEAGHRIQMAETPRDRVGLFLLAFLGAITLGGAVTTSRQLRGKRPQASGEFRWR
jgi:hypothetical protein